MAYNGDPEKDLMVQFMDHKTISLQTVINAIENMRYNCENNHKDPKDVPFIIRTNNLNYAIPWYGLGIGFGAKGVVASIEYYSSEQIMPVVEDIRPEQEDAEYWASRGVSSSDVSGFVKSKQAGLRLLRMVKYVLEKDETESWLDWRETEPEWIQFKFSNKEFDIHKLHSMSEKAGGIITMNILKGCKLLNYE